MGRLLKWKFVTVNLRFDRNEDGHLTIKILYHMIYENQGKGKIKVYIGVISLILGKLILVQSSPIRQYLLPLCDIGYSRHAVIAILINSPGIRQGMITEDFRRLP